MISTENRLRYIENLSLEPLSGELGPMETRPLAMKDGEKEAFVDAGSLISFTTGVSFQHKEDVLNSTLLAQLAANKLYDREKETEKWYLKYREVLENVGWVITSFDFARFKSQGSKFTADTVISEVLSALGGTKEDLTVIDAAIDAVKGLDQGDGRLVLWDQNSTSFSKGNFQIAVCGEIDGVAVLKLGAFYFSTDEDVTRVLWFEFSSSETEMYQGGQTIKLNDVVYEIVRGAIIEKLGNKARTYVASLEI